MRRELICLPIMSVVALDGLASIGPAAAQPSVPELCARENGRLIATCPATCEPACNTPGFAVRSQAVLQACRQLQESQRRTDNPQCTTLFAGPRAPPVPEPTGPVRRQAIPGKFGVLGQGAEACIGQVSKSETIEQRVARIGNPRLKENVAAFWAGRPDCAPSSEALVDTFQCIQGGANEISQGYSDIRRQFTLTGQSRDEFCRAAKPLTEGDAYTELEQVDERVARFDSKVAELNECAKKYASWSEQRGARPSGPPDSSASPSSGVAPAPILPDLVHELSQQLQENLQKFAGVQAGFIEIRENIHAVKRDITSAVARAVNICQ